MHASDEYNEVEHLKQLLKDQEVSAKLLVRRDRELTRAHEKIQELGQMKSDFIFVVAHQLRTPLSVTKWALDILGENAHESLTSEQQAILARGKESNERMIQLVDDLLKVDLYETGKVQYMLTVVPISELIQPVVDRLLPLAAQQGVTLEYVAPEGELSPVHVDVEKLGAALQNVMENAVKYSPKDSVVNIAVQEKSPHLIVSIHDTGIGIPPEDKEKIFSKFYRGTNAVKAQTEGSGLGLFMTRKIIKRHGGEIWFESSAGGTTFYISIPTDTTN